METSASFEARYAPLSYPTAGGARRLASLPRPEIVILLSFARVAKRGHQYLWFDVGYPRAYWEWKQTGLLIAES